MTNFKEWLLTASLVVLTALLFISAFVWRVGLIAFFVVCVSYVLHFIFGIPFIVDLL